MAETASPLTPCKNICRLDACGKLCLGCGRTSAEITGWMRYSEDQRRAVMAQLPARLEKLERLRRAAGITNTAHKI